MQNTCVHSFITPERCGKPAFARRTHGYLCAGHYRQQQESIPPKPRKPQPKWIGLHVPTDEELIASIIRTDSEAIAAGRIVEWKRGRFEPVVLRILEPAIAQQ